MAFGEESCHIIWSPYLGQGSEAGFAFIFRPGRLAGSARRTTETVIFESRTRPGGNPRTPLRSLFHRDRPAARGDMEGVVIRARIVDPWKVDEIAKSGRPKPFVVKSDTSTFVTKDPDEARRIAIEFGIDIGTLRRPGDSRVPEGTAPGGGSSGENPGGEGDPGGGSGPGIPLSPAGLLAYLEGARVFDYPADAIEGIEVVPPAASAPGRIVIRTPQGVQVVNVAPPAFPAEDPIPALVPRFEMLAPGRVVHPA